MQLRLSLLQYGGVGDVIVQLVGVIKVSDEQAKLSYLVDTNNCNRNLQNATLMLVGINAAPIRQYYTTVVILSHIITYHDEKDKCNCAEVINDVIPEATFGLMDLSLQLQYMARVV